MNNRDGKKNYQVGVTNSNNHNGNLIQFAGPKGANLDYTFEEGFQNDYNKANVGLFLILAREEDRRKGK